MERAFSEHTFMLNVFKMGYKIFVLFFRLESRMGLNLEFHTLLGSISSR